MDILRNDMEGYGMIMISRFVKLTWNFHECVWAEIWRFFQFLQCQLRMEAEGCLQEDLELSDAEARISNEAADDMIAKRKWQKILYQCGCARIWKTIFVEIHCFAKHDFEKKKTSKWIHPCSACFMLLSSWWFLFAKFPSLQKASGFWQSFRTWVQPNLGKKETSHSDHQIYYIFNRESQPKPLFSTGILGHTQPKHDFFSIFVS